MTDRGEEHCLWGVGCMCVYCTHTTTLQNQTKPFLVEKSANDFFSFVRSDKIGNHRKSWSKTKIVNCTIGLGLVLTISQAKQRPGIANKGMSAFVGTFQEEKSGISGKFW